MSLLLLLKGGAAATAYTLDAQSGSFVVTGQDATLTSTKVVNAQNGSFTLTGQNATFYKTFSFNAESGSYTVSGADADLTVESPTVIINASSGSYTIDGKTAEFTVQRIFNAESGTYTLSGQISTAVRTYSLNAASGIYTIAGAPVSFKYPRWPLPSEVAFGVQYGPNGDDYTGTYIGNNKIEVNTGRIVKSLTNTAAVLL